jgi:uncharacterized protein (TIGR02452 family)
MADKDAGRLDDRRQWLRDIVTANADMVEEIDAHWDEGKNEGDRAPVEGTVRIGSLPALPDDTERGLSPVSVDRRNAADVAAQFCSLGFSPAIVSPGSRWKPGGTYVRGGWGGEPDLLRRCPQLYPALEGARYPLHAVDTLYTPNVSIVRDRRLNVVEWEDVTRTAVITATPVQGKRGDETHRLTRSQRTLMSAKIRVAIATAARYGHDVLILPAFGCVVYNLDPEEVAEIFRAVLASPECPLFKHVVFSVPPHGNRGRRNAEVFEEAFGLV